MAYHNCPVCHERMKNAFSATVLSKHSVKYFECISCGFLQTEKPFWLDEAYSDAIVKADTGLVSRNLYASKYTSILLYTTFDAEAFYLDVAGGYGLFVRLMRDNGFDYYWEDDYCENLMARGFESDNLDRQYLCLTAFEVLEHLYDPLTFIKNKISKHHSEAFIFTTELYDPNTCDQNWWYYTFSTGQHISFFQLKTLNKIAEILNMQFYNLGGIFLFTKKHYSFGLFKVIKKLKLSGIFFKYVKWRLKSKILIDHIRLLNK